MAVKTYYCLGTAAPSPNFFGQLQDGGSAPTAANSTYGWAPAKTATTTPYWAARLGASSTVATASSTSTIDPDTSPAKGTGATNTTAGDSFVTPTALTGNFANTAWTFSWNMRAGVAGAVGRIRMRVWASVNADGTSARELTAGAQLGAIVTLSTTADTNSSISWSPGVVTLNNEFLFFQLEWQETTAGSSNTDTVLFRIGTASIVTPVFSINLTFSVSSPETLTAIAVNPSVVTDNFNRADGPLGSNYTQNTNNFAPLGIVSNQIYGSAGSFEIACWIANNFKNDQFAQVTATSSGSYVGVLVRAQSNANSGYFGVVSGGNAIIYRIDNNAFTSLNSVSYTATSGNVVRLEISGSTLTLKINGVSILTASDSTYASGYPGVAAANGENGDNWSAGPIVLPVTYPQLASLASSELVALTKLKSYAKLVTWSNPQIYSSVKSILKNVTAAIQSVVVINRAISKSTSLTSPEILTIARQKTRLLSISLVSHQIVTDVISRMLIRTFSITIMPMLTGANFVTKNVTGKLSIVGPEILTLTRITSRFRGIVVSIGEIVTLATQYIPGTNVNQKLVSITESSLVTNIRTIYRTYVIAFPENVTAIRIALKLKLVTYTNSELVSLIRSTGKSLLVISLETVTLARISSRFRTIVSSIGEIVTQFNQKAFLKTILPSIGETVTQANQKAFLRTLTVTSSEVFTYTKSIIKAFSITSLETVTLAKISSRFRTIVALIGESITQANQKAFLRTILITSSEVVTYTLLKARVLLVSLTQSEIVTRVSLNVKTIIVSTSETVRRQAAIVKTLVAKISETVLAFTGNTVFSVINHPQIISIYKITGRLVILAQSQLVSLIRISSKLTSFVNHELVTQFNQKAFLKIVFLLHHEVFTRISVVSRTLLFANSSVITVSRIISRAVVLTQSQLASFAKVLSRTVVFTNHEVITSTFGKLYKRAVSVASPETLVSVRSFTKQFLFSQFQLITRNSISTKLVSITQSEVVQRSISIFKNVGFVSSETLTLLRPTRSKIISLYNSSVLSSTRILGHIVNIIINQKFFKAAIDVPINFTQTQFVKTTGSISRKLFLFNRSSINVIAGKVRGILASIKTSQFWSYVTSKFWYLPNFLQPDGMLSFEWVNVKGWTPVASGLNLAIGIVLEVRRGECLIAYTPSLDIPPTLPYAVDNQGDIHLMVDSKIAWIRSADPTAYITVKGRIEYTAKKRIAA